MIAYGRVIFKKKIQGWKKNRQNFLNTNSFPGFQEVISKRVNVNYNIESNSGKNYYNYCLTKIGMIYFTHRNHVFSI